MNEVPLGYRYLWAIVTGVSVVTGALLALVTLLVGAWITVLIFGALMGCAALHLLRENRTRMAAAWDYGTAAASGAVISLAAAGLVSAFEGSGAALVAVLAVASPAAVRWYRRGLRQWQPDRSHSPAGAAGTVVAQALVVPGAGTEPSEQLAGRITAKLASLSDRDLLESWRLSSLSLAAARTPTQISRQVLGRSMILDEIQRRHPAGFASWIGDGAPAGGDPSGYAQPTPEARGDDTD